MTKSKKMFSEPQRIESILNSAEFIFLAFNDEDAPYILPFNFCYKSGDLFIHTGFKGKKLDLLKKNPLVGFAVTGKASFIGEGDPAEWTYKYESVTGKGEAVTVENTEEKRKALMALLNHYQRFEGELGEKTIKAAQVIKIRITEISGKSNITE